MTRLVLEIDQEKDVDLLLALLERLNIQVVQKKSEETHNAANEDLIFLLKGLAARKDLDAFLLDFELSRKDRLLPGRE